MWECEDDQEKDFFEKPCLAHYAKDKYNIVTIDATKTRIDSTIWEQDGNV